MTKSNKLKLAVTEPQPRRPTRLAIMIELLERPEGASVDQLQTATGWQAHSIRGAMSGSLKKRLGLTIHSEKGDGARVYRITADGAVRSNASGAGDTA